MIVVSRNAALRRQIDRFDLPVIGWDNAVTTTNVTATSTEGGYAVANLANPATHLAWRAEQTSPPGTTQYLTVTLGDLREFDYLGVARHNFGSAQIRCSVEGFIDAAWTELVEDALLPNDAPAIFRFDPVLLDRIRLKLAIDASLADPEVPQVAVLYAGSLTTMARGLWVGHTPLAHARKSKVISGRSESGNFLGRIELNALRESAARFRFVDPGWFRITMADFLTAARDKPFFFAWRPGSYPRETGFAWLMNDPMPVPDDTSHLYEIELQMQGIA